MYAWSQRGPHTLETPCSAATDIEKSSSCISSVSAFVCNSCIPVYARSENCSLLGKCPIMQTRLSLDICESVSSTVSCTAQRRQTMATCSSAHPADIIAPFQCSLCWLWTHDITVPGSESKHKRYCARLSHPTVMLSSCLSHKAVQAFN